MSVPSTETITNAGAQVAVEGWSWVMAALQDMVAYNGGRPLTCLA